MTVYLLRVYLSGSLVNRKSTTPPKDRLPGNMVLAMGYSGMILTSIWSVDMDETTRSNTRFIRTRHPASVYIERNEVDDNIQTLHLQPRTHGVEPTV
jgi:hypothetical protein